MKQEQPKVNHFIDLRLRAEEVVHNQRVDVAKLSTDDIQHLVHELQVHQIELEMQNEELRRSQLQLKKSRDRYINLYNFAPMGYFTVDEKGLILEANLTGATMLGIQKNSLLKESFFRFVAKDDEDTFYLHCKQVLKTQTRQACELKMKRKDEVPFDVRLESMVGQDDQGMFSHLRVAAIDITPRVAAEKVLRESEERFRALVESPHIAIGISKQGNSVYVNQAFLDTFGYDDLSEVQNTPILKYIARHRHQEVIEMVRKRERGATVPDGYETIGQRKDGSHFPLYVQSCRIVLPDGPALVGFFADITERKWAEEELKKYRSQLEELVAERTTELIRANEQLQREIVERKQTEETLRQRNEELTTLNALAGLISQSSNLEHILEATLEMVLHTLDTNLGWIELLDQSGDSRSQITPNRFSDDIVKMVKLEEGISYRVLQSGQAIVLDRVLGIPWPGREREEIDKQELGCAFACIPIKTKDNVLGVISVFSRQPDQLSSQVVQLLTAIGYQIGVAIENARLAEEVAEIKVLQELDHLRSKLIANVSHELRTPLGLIKIFGTILLSKDIALNHETQLECLHSIDEEVDKLEEIVNNLLDISRLESRGLHLNKQTTDLVQLVTELTTTMEVQLTQHHFSFDFSTKPLIANLDAKLIKRVLSNLLSNAIKYSPQGGKITIRTSRQKGQVRFEIGDQGMGIAAENLSRVFERFYRVEDELTQNIRGVGLGLAICWEIVAAHGGCIWVESSYGKGSTFYFILPVDDEIF